MSSMTQTLIEFYMKYCYSNNSTIYKLYVTFYGDLALFDRNNTFMYIKIFLNQYILCIVCVKFTFIHYRCSSFNLLKIHLQQIKYA